MSIQNANTLHAVALVAADGTLVGGQGMGGAVRIGPGEYVVGILRPLGQGERVVGITADGGGPVAVEWTTPIGMRVLTRNSSYAQADQSFFLEVHRLPTVGS